MKKMFIYVIALICLLSFAGVAAAITTVTGSGGIGGTSTLWISTSSNVRISYEASEQAYGAQGEHKAGNRAYRTGSGTPGLFYNEAKVAGEYLENSDLGSDFGGGGEWKAQ
jgi:hypothetical protein